MTLFEIVIVIALVGALLAIALPNFVTSLSAEQLAESTSRFRALISMCRAQAMNDARVYRIRCLEDGSIRVERQVDAVYAPHVFLPVTEQWARTEILGERVWIDQILDLPDGPPPFDVEDDLIEFDEMIEEPEDIEELAEPLDILFQPDGLSDSVQWVIRDLDGRGIELTLDGRLGRLELQYLDKLPEGEVSKPDVMVTEDLEWEGMSEQEVLQEFMPT